MSAASSLDFAIAASKDIRKCGKVRDLPVRKLQLAKKPEKSILQFINVEEINSASYHPVTIE